MTKAKDWPYVSKIELQKLQMEVNCDSVNSEEETVNNLFNMNLFLRSSSFKPRANIKKIIQ